MGIRQFFSVILILAVFSLVLGCVSSPAAKNTTANTSPTATEASLTTVSTPAPTVITTVPTVCPVHPDLNRSYWLTIDPIGDKYRGETFNITGTTNWPQEDYVFFVMSTSTRKFVGKPIFDESNLQSGYSWMPTGENCLKKFSIAINTTKLIPDEYLVEIQSDVDVYNATLFNLLEPNATETVTTSGTGAGNVTRRS